MQEKQADKKRLRMGMCNRSRPHVHKQKFIVNSSVNKDMCNQEFAATKNEYLHWFAMYQATNTFVDGRSYAQVLSCTPPSCNKKSQAFKPIRGCHTGRRCWRLPPGTGGSETKLSTLRPSCKHTTFAKGKSHGSGKKVTSNAQNARNTLLLSNRFQVLQEIDKNVMHENADVECSTSCHTVAGSSQPSYNDQVIVSNNNKDSTPDTWFQKLRDISINSDGDGISNSNRLGLVQSNIVAGGNEHSLESVTTKMSTNITQGGYKNQHMSNADYSAQSELGFKGHKAIADTLEPYLPHLENDFMADLSAENHFSKSFLANTEVPQVIRQQCQGSRDFRL